MNVFLVLMAAVAIVWVCVFAYQWRHRKDLRPATEAILVEIIMILTALAALFVEFLLLLGAIFL